MLLPISISYLSRSFTTTTNLEIITYEKFIMRPLARFSRALRTTYESCWLWYKVAQQLFDMCFHWVAFDGPYCFSFIHKVYPHSYYLHLNEIHTNYCVIRLNFSGQCNVQIYYFLRYLSNGFLTPWRAKVYIILLDVDNMALARHAHIKYSKELY